MKKLLYFLLSLFITSMTISSCTEDAVKPADNGGGGGGISYDGK